VNIVTCSIFEKTAFLLRSDDRVIGEGSSHRLRRWSSQDSALSPAGFGVDNDLPLICTAIRKNGTHDPT
jgi:hypothetical protein